jgi:adenylate kinase family enzyme
MTDAIHEALRTRSIIMGNSGAGKSWLAGRLAALVRAPAIDLDALHWEDAGYRRKRDEEMARQMTRAAASEPRWIIEGVYGWLVEVALPRATALGWLDLPWSDCRSALLARGPSRDAHDTAFAELLDWAGAYWSRQTSTSFAGHGRIFEGFSGAKVRLHDRDGVLALLAEVGER